MASAENEMVVSSFNSAVQGIADRLHKIDVEKKQTEMELDKTKLERNQAISEVENYKNRIRKASLRAIQADDRSTCSLLWLIAVCIGFAIYFTWTQLFW